MLTKKLSNCPISQGMVRVLVRNVAVIMRQLPVAASAVGPKEALPRRRRPEAVQCRRAAEVAGVVGVAGGQGGEGCT